MRDHQQAHEGEVSVEPSFFLVNCLTIDYPQHDWGMAIFIYSGLAAKEAVMDLDEFQLTFEF